ncbi:MAG: hypothetical protein L0Z50_06210, partial [Verrucomicrobiales bacterium]|nr:hypothetical protein [Verrucomicrobiales bacterium]
DAVAYQREPGPDPDIYCLIHERISQCMAQLRMSTGQADVPLLVIAHSLGSYIMSNYIWDLQNPKAYCKNVVPQTPFEQMKTLAGFVTFGSIIPLFTLALTKFEGITFPPAELAGNVRAAARWLNLYDPDDVLGYPIKPLCPRYADNAQIEDHAINVGDLLTSWNPLSHTDYWTDNDFTKPVARLIEAILSA